MANDRFNEQQQTIHRNSKYVVTREYGPDPYGQPFKGMWVVRIYETGEYVEHGTYVEDLLEKYR